MSVLNIAAVVFDEILFCDIMLDHYHTVFMQHRRSWEWKEAFFAWKQYKKYHRYKKEAEAAQAVAIENLRGTGVSMSQKDGLNI